MKNVAKQLAISYPKHNEITTKYSWRDALTVYANNIFSAANTLFRLTLFLISFLLMGYSFSVLLFKIHVQIHFENKTTIK
jgi:predicted membrane protein